MLCKLTTMKTASTLLSQPISTFSATKALEAALQVQDEPPSSLHTLKGATKFETTTLFQALFLGDVGPNVTGHEDEDETYFFPSIAWPSCQEECERIVANANARQRQQESKSTFHKIKKGSKHRLVRSHPSLRGPASMNHSYTI